MKHTISALPDAAQDLARKLLDDRHKFYKRWGDVAAEFGITRGQAHLVWSGKRKAPKALLDRMGISVIQTAPAPVCSVHGVVHIGRCKRPKVSRAELLDRPGALKEIARIVGWAEKQSR